MIDSFLIRAKITTERAEHLGLWIVERAQTVCKEWVDTSDRGTTENVKE